MKDRILQNLLNDTEEALEKYGWEYNHNTMKLMLQEWAENKTELRNLFSKHPNWVEEKQYIVFKQDYERKRDNKAVEYFLDWLTYKLENSFVDLGTIVPELEECSYRYFYRSTLETLLHVVLFPICMGKENVCSKEGEEVLNKIFPKMGFKEGQRISRIVNKICKKIKIDKEEGYDKEFAKFSDALNPIKYKRFTVLSINPVDYLLMANGNSWTSCMTIDTKQRYQTDFHGESCSGTISYMLDTTSFVLYTVDAKYNKDQYEIEPKINRQMYQYSNFKLLQGRLYPQSNDGEIGNQLRTELRNIVQKIIADCLEMPNLWTLKNSTNYDYYNYFYDVPNATHYPDYLYDKNKCTLSLMQLKDKDLIFKQQNRIRIGEDNHCIVCGGYSTNKSSLYCQNCKELLENEEDNECNDEEW